MIHILERPEQLDPLMDALCSQPPLTLDQRLDLLEAWREAIVADDAAINVPGALFLNLWLRRSNLQSVLKRELGAEELTGGWSDAEGVKTRWFPVGVVAHWPAGNIEIQPILSLTTAFLGGNRSVVRVSPSLLRSVEPLLAVLDRFEGGQEILSRSLFVSFDRQAQSIHSRMASLVDGAMIWGGHEAVMNLRSLPFPPLAKLAVFGPRYSAVLMDAGAWAEEKVRTAWCRRLARDLWPFEQQACSSPQPIFVQRSESLDEQLILDSLQEALEREAAIHPREQLDPALTSEIVRSRARWLMADPEHAARFPSTPEWTLLIGEGYELVKGGRILTLQFVDQLEDALKRLDRNAQTLGLAMADREEALRIAEQAGCQGIDRIVPVGRMHVYDSPWDGHPLVCSMMRQVRFIAG
uniref:Putative Acyl protein synthase/acyl-CoA reductase RfbN. Putative oxidoreductase activity n=1 Tax=Magnetococcus massalia (strain MO-1) TaxID=451514 RepID=A0A1S7LF49_MAGMO|nr:putative Acyl protein synthase/acyl-CoA reductase RfbN. Putative oxidoreductase activity [Candidatus Magnetococcus massalia]